MSTLPETALDEREHIRIKWKATCRYCGHTRSAGFSTAVNDACAQGLATSQANAWYSRHTQSCTQRPNEAPTIETTSSRVKGPIR